MRRYPNRPALLSRIERLESRAYLSATTFGAPVFHGGWADVASIAAGVLTTGGKTDLVLTGDLAGTTNAAVGIYINQGAGTYGVATLIPFSGTPGPVAIGDFLGNGKMDIATLDPSTGFVDVFLNDGSGNFSQGVGGSISVTGGSSIAVGDFNGDGKLDLAIANTTGNRVDILLSRGDQSGSFDAGATISVPSPTKVIASDVTGDGLSDLIIAGSSTPGTVYVATNQGSGSFAAPVPYNLSTTTQALSDIAVADFNADSHPDIVAVANDTASVSTVAGVLINQGTGTFADATNNTVATGATLVGAGNFTNTGGTDIASLTPAGGLDVLPHGGAIATFQPDQSVFTTQLGAIGSSAIFADLDGDGLTDVAYASPSNSGFGVALDTTPGTIPPPVTGTTSTLTPTLTGSLPAAPLVAGAKLKPIHEKVVINNNSASPVTGSVKIEIVLSAAQTPANGDPAVATLTRTLTFKAHQSKPFTLTIGSLPSSADGSYYLVALVTDPTFATNTAASATTISIVPPTIDLAGAFVSAPATARIGHPIAATFTVTNAGSIPTSQRLEIKVYASPTGSIDANAIEIDDLFHPGVIRPGKPVKIRVSKTLAKSMPAGNYYLVIQLDPANVFSDTNAADNTFVSAAVAVGV